MLNESRIDFWCTVALIAAIIFGVSVKVASAQTACGYKNPTDVVHEMMEDHGEALQVEALSSGGNVMQIFANEETGGWTVFFWTPDGQICQMGAGTDWFEGPFPTDPVGDPT